MLGPIVALLLLTSPAAGPVDQLCFSLNSEAQRTCERQNQLERRIEALEQPTFRLPSIVPDYSTPSRPSQSFPSLFPDSSLGQQPLFPLLDAV